MIPKGIRDKTATLAGRKSGRPFFTVVIGGVISLIIAVAALYVSTYAGRSSLPTPLPVQVQLAPRMATIQPSSALFEPPAPPLIQTPAVNNGASRTGAVSVNSSGTTGGRIAAAVTGPPADEAVWAVNAGVPAASVPSDSGGAYRHGDDDHSEDDGGDRGHNNHHD